MMKKIKEQPVLFWSNLTTVVESVIGAVLILGLVMWTPEQVGSIMLAVAALGGFLSKFVQGKVTPTHRPRDDAGNPLTPGPIGSEDSEALPPP